jgi:membrane protein DedA with SNARE-associated domain
VLGAVLSGLRLLAGVGTPVGAALDYLVFLASLGFSMWYVVLVVIGAAFARDIGYGESAGSCALSCVGLVVLIIVVVIAAAVGIFATVNAAAP